MCAPCTVHLAIATHQLQILIPQTLRDLGYLVYLLQATKKN